jgi:hypothetical protein
MHVSTYWRREFVSANWLCAKVNRDCTSLDRFARVAAIRASSWVVASLSSPRSNSFSQAARMNACSDRKPRSFAAVLIRLRNSIFGKIPLSSLFFHRIASISGRWHICGTNGSKAATVHEYEKLSVTRKKPRSIATFLYVPIPSKPSKNSHSTARYLSLPCPTLSALVRNNPLRSVTVRCGPPQSAPARFGPFLSPSAEFICISESQLRYAYTTHDDVNLKIVAVQLWKNTEQAPRKLWESLVHDDHKTFTAIIRRALKNPAQPRRTAGKSPDRAPISTKKILTFCTLEVP